MHSAPSSAPPSPPNDASVVIIGAGFSGVMTAVQLMNRRRGPLTILLVEQTGQFARGLAYSSVDELHLLNVPAGRMSAFPDAPNDFLEFARRENAAVAASDFLPRTAYGRYLQQILTTAELSHPEVTVSRLTGQAVGIDPHDSGFLVRLKDSSTVRTNAVVFALGIKPESRMASLLPEQERHRVVSPWATELLRGLDKDLDVAIIGTGLTMVDVALTLSAAGHRGSLVAISRHGLLPAVHKPPGPGPISEHPATSDLAKLMSALTAGADTARMLRELRHSIMQVESAGLGWRLGFDSLRASTPNLWKALGIAGQRRFLRHARRYWDVHRHRMAPVAGAAITQLVASGKLSDIPGRLIEVAPRGNRLNLQLGGRTELSSLLTDIIVDCTGIDRQVRRSADPLVRELLNKGLAVDDPHGLGFATERDGRLVGTGGLLFTIGAWRKGELWESVAVPELRTQAADLGAVLAHELATSVPQVSPKTVGHSVHPAHL